MGQKKILLIQTAFIGDVILASAMLEKLHVAYPEAEIHFLVRKGNESLFKGHPYIREVLVFDKSHKYKNLLKIIRKIRAERYDYVINAQRFFTTGLITALSKGKVTIGFDKNPLSFLFSQVVSHQIGEKHETDRNHLLIAAITDEHSAKPRLYPTKDDDERIKPYLRDPFICIAPTSVWFTKQYPQEEWIKFIDQLPEKLVVYLLGAPDDSKACEAMVKATQHANTINMAGKLSLLQSAALMQKAKMNYVNDSAPMHLCSAVNAPVAAIYCSTIPGFGFGPLADTSFIIETSRDLKCRPCGLHGHRACPEKHFECAFSIDQQSMLDLIV